MRPWDAARSKWRGRDAVAFGGEEDGNAGDQKGLRETFDDGVEQGAQVGLGVQAAAKLDQRLAVVEALLIEDAIDAGLDGAFEGFEQDSGDDDSSQQTPDTQAGEAGVEHLRGDGDDAEVEADQRGGRERVGDATFEDEIDVHQAVADDGPAEGEGKNDQREAGELGLEAGDVPVGQVGDGVKQREGGDGEQCAASKPLELLAFQGRLGGAIAEAEDDGRDDVVERQIADGDLVEAMMQKLRGGPVVEWPRTGARSGRFREYRAGHRRTCVEGDAAASMRRVREADCEVQKECRLQSLRRHVAPVDDLVEDVQLAGVFEAVEDERGQAEDVEVGGFGRGPASEEDVDSDTEVDERDKAQTLVDGAIRGLEDDLNIETCGILQVVHVRSGAEDGVGCVCPDAAVEHLADEGGQARGGVVVDAEEDVAGANARAVARGVERDALCLKAAGGLDPPDAVGGDVVASLSLEIDRGEHAGSQRRDGERYSQDARLRGVIHDDPAIQQQLEQIEYQTEE